MVASLCLVIPRARLEFVNRATLVALLNDAAERIARLAADVTHDVDDLATAKAGERPRLAR